MKKKTLFLFLNLYMMFINISCHSSRPIGEWAQLAWERLPEIEREITAPVFPPRRVMVTDFGAAGDGRTDCTAAIRKAIDSCARKGGGTVVIPEGAYLTGAIHLRSNINLHLQANARLLFKTAPEAYLPIVLTRYEGVECMNYSPFIYAIDQENVAITGPGTIDGQACEENWWIWKGQEKYGWRPNLKHGNDDAELLFSMAEQGVPVSERVFGDGHYLRPNFIQFYRCKNVLIDSVTIVRSPMWVIHPVLSSNVIVQNVIVKSHGPNNDGCNPESSKNVMIRNCFFDSGDDCIAIKSGRNADGRRLNVASENIVIRDCVMKDGHGGVVIGSETSGSVRNVFVERCIMDSPHLERAIRIKTNSVRGGTVENIFVRDIQVG